MGDGEKYKKGTKVPNTKSDQYEKIFTRAIADPNRASSGNKDFDSNELFQAMPVFDHSKSIIKKNKEILELFPDLELGIKIANSSLISPNNMEDEPTRIRMKKDNGAPSLVNSAISTIATGFISNKLNYSKISADAKFFKGAWIHATIPEVLLDNIIANSIEGTESDSKIDDSGMNKKTNKQSNVGSLGIFNSKSLVSSDYISGLESEIGYVVKEENKPENIKALEKLLFLEDVISDDCLSLKSTESALESAEKVIKNKLKLLSKKANKKLTEEEIKSVFSTAKKTREEFIALPSTSPSSNRGTSLDLELPVSSCIPVFPSGEPHKHIGYFILINPLTGTPIQDDEYSTRNEGFNRSYNTGLTSTGNNDYVTKVLENFKSSSEDVPKIRELDKIYNKLLDLKLKNVLRDSIYGDMVSVDITTNEAYRVMLSRVLEAKQTRMIFLPRELVSYIAFEHRDNGTGKSLLEKVDFYVNSRAIIFFTNIMAKIQNSMSNTRVRAEIDENHPNAKAMRANIMSEYLKSRGTMYPYNVYRHNELAEWSKFAGIQFDIRHPSFGNTDISIEEVTNEKKEIDIELEEKITDYIYYTLGVTREQIEAAKSEDFATAVASRNKMMANRIREDQNIFTPQISELIKRKCRYDITTYEQMRTVAEDNLQDLKNYLSNLYGEDETEEILKDKESAADIATECLIDDLEFFLPKPEVTEDNTKMTQFENFTTRLDSILSAIISDDTITEDSLGELNMKKEDITKMLKFSATLDYIRSNGVMDYISDMFTLDNEEKALVNPIEEYATATKVLANSILLSKKTIANMNSKINKENTKLDDKINAEANPEDTGGDSEFETGEGTGGNNFGTSNAEEEQDTTKREEIDITGNDGTKEDVENEKEETDETKEVEPDVEGKEPPNKEEAKEEKSEEEETEETGLTEREVVPEDETGLTEREVAPEDEEEETEEK